jgi:hypothetical protein
MERVDDGFPYPVIEWHPDTGSEFVNWLCEQWADQRKQRLSRSRPNRKNDNCFVEERNGHIVRKWVGYARFDDERLVALMNELYEVLTPYLNHFLASKRIISKERIGAKWKVLREKVSRTPYQRVMARHDIAGEVKSQLQIEHEKLNPLVLKREIDQRLKTLFNARKRYAEPKL